MAITIGSSVKASYTLSDSTTTSSVTTVTGSTFVVGVVNEGGNTVTVTDSKGNTYTGIGTQLSASDGSFTNYTRLFYCSAGTGGTNHTFTASAVGGYSTLFVVELRGTDVTLDTQSGASDDAASPYTSGAVTPSVANTMAVTVIGTVGTGTLTYTAGNSFTKLLEEGSADTVWAGALGYKGVATATSTEASWTVTGGTDHNVALAIFKETEEEEPPPEEEDTRGFTRVHIVPHYRTHLRTHLRSSSGGASPAVLSLSGNAPNDVEDSAFTYTYTASGGETPYTFSISAGALPTGVTLNTSTGTISGVPTTPGTYTWTVLVTDNNSDTASVSDGNTISAVGGSPDVVYLQLSNENKDPIEALATMAVGDTVVNQYGITVRRTTASGKRHLYSRVHAFKPDHSAYLAQRTDGFHDLIETDTGNVIKTLVGPANGGIGGGNGDGCWLDNRYLATTGSLGELKGVNRIDTDAATQNASAVTQMFRLPSTIGGITYTYAFTGGEGRCSDDGTRWPFLLLDGSYTCLGFCVWDTTLNAGVGGVLWSAANVGGSVNPDHCSISRTGRYFIVSRVRNLNDGSNPYEHAGTWAIDLNTGGNPAYQISPGSAHSDTILLSDGTDGMVIWNGDSVSPNQYDVYYCPLNDPLNRTVIMNPYNTTPDASNDGWHFSGFKDGWILVSAYNSSAGVGDDTRNRWWDNRICAVEAKAGAADISELQVVILADTLSDRTVYEAEPHANWSSDGERIVFSSNWTNGASGASTIGDYVLTVPDFWNYTGPEAGS